MRGYGYLDSAYYDHHSSHTTLGSRSTHGTHSKQERSHDDESDDEEDRLHDSVEEEDHMDDHFIDMYRQEILKQQTTMVSILSEIDNQLQEHMEQKQREDFEKSLEEKIKTQNSLLLDQIQRSLPVMQQMPYFYPQPMALQAQQVQFQQQPQQMPYYGQPYNPYGQPQVMTQQHSPNQGGMTRNARSPTMVKPNVLQRQTTMIQNGMPQSPQQMHTQQASPQQQQHEFLQQQDGMVSPDGYGDDIEEPKSIWERLMDNDADLLQASDDEEEKKKEVELKKQQEAAKKRKTMPKIVVYGNGKPMYRWIAAGVPNPDPLQVLKGKSLFRAIACVFVALRRMEKEALDKKRALLNEDIKEMETAIKWFKDKTTTWLGQVLSLPIIDVVTKNDLVLDPKSGFTFKSVGFVARLKQKRKKGSSATEDEETKQNNLEKQVNTIALRIKVRVRAMLEALLHALSSDKNQLPPSICAFLLRIISDGCSFPEHYLYPEESKSLEFSPIKQTRWMIPPVLEDKEEPFTENQQSMKYDLSRVRIILASFVVTRCLIPLILRPWEAGLGKKPEKRQVSNLNILGTMFYLLYQTEFGGPDPGDADPEEEKVGGFGGALKLIKVKGGADTSTKTDDQHSKQSGHFFGRFRKKNKVKPPSPTSAGQNQDRGESERVTSSGDQDDIQKKNSTTRESGNNNTSDSVLARKEQESIENSGKYETIYDLTSTLPARKQMSMLDGKLQFMDEMQVLMNLFVMKLLRKVFASAKDDDSCPPGLMEHIEEEILVLKEMRKKHEDGNARRLVIKRNEELERRLKEAEEQKRLEELKKQQQEEEALRREQEEAKQKKEEAKKKKKKKKKKKDKKDDDDDDDDDDADEEDDEEEDEDEEDDDEDDDDEEDDGDNNKRKTKVDDNDDDNDEEEGEEDDDDDDDDKNKVKKRKKNSGKQSDDDIGDDEDEDDNDNDDEDDENKSDHEDQQNNKRRSSVGSARRTSIGSRGSNRSGSARRRDSIASRTSNRSDSQSQRRRRSSITPRSVDELEMTTPRRRSSVTSTRIEDVAPKRRNSVSSVRSTASNPRRRRSVQEIAPKRRSSVSSNASVKSSARSSGRRGSVSSKA